MFAGRLLRQILRQQYDEHSQTYGFKNYSRVMRANIYFRFQS
jgi:hypothetical protein